MKKQELTPKQRLFVAEYLKDLNAKQRVVEMEILPRSLTVIAGNGIGLSMPVEAAPSVSAKQENPNEVNGTSAEFMRSVSEPAKP